MHDCMWLGWWEGVIKINDKPFTDPARLTWKYCLCPFPPAPQSWSFELSQWRERKHRITEALFAAHRTTPAAPGGGKWPRAMPFLHSLFISAHSKCQHTNKSSVLYRPSTLCKLLDSTHHEHGRTKILPVTSCFLIKGIWSFNSGWWLVNGDFWAL